MFSDVCFFRFGNWNIMNIDCFNEQHWTYTSAHDHAFLYNIEPGVGFLNVRICTFFTHILSLVTPDLVGV